MTGVAVAAPSQAAVDAALAIGEAGGNAVDACIAALVVSTVTEFGIVGPMGGAFVNVWAPGEDAVVLDGNVEMPGRGREPERFGEGIQRFECDYFGPLVVHGGPGTVGTPGMFKALDIAHRRWGALPWREVVLPAAHVAREGYRMGPAAAFWLSRSGPHHFGWDDECVAYLRQGPGGDLPVAGQNMRSSDLATSLEAVARDGVDTLYTGELAHAIAADMDVRGGLLGLADLAAYEVVERRALRARVGRFDVATNPAPSIGGPVLAALLRTLQASRDGGRVSPGDVIDALRLVLGYRWGVIDHADDLEAAGHEMMRLLDEHGPDGLILSNSPDTIHVSAVDADGMAVSITTSCGYCSGYMTPGTGLMFNNALGEPELNRRGFHVQPPGSRMPSNMAPTTARSDTGSVLSIGSPGADRITTALLTVLTSLALNGDTLEQAVLHPRIHLGITDEGLRLDLEGDAEAEAAAASAAAAHGLQVARHEGLTMYFGGVGAAYVSADGTLAAVGDPRRAAITGTN
ncbi:MAG: gamma-glutamyltransferase [Dermatophilus congolensis]|nr:gamma-glutamyltransferase [Dermatophilus congolensis]